MNSSSRPRIHPTIVLTAGILSVSTAAILIRYAQTGAPSMVIAAYRLIMATLLLAPFALLRNRDEIKRLNRSQWLLLLLAGFFLALHFISWIYSLSMTSVASSVVLVTTTPLWVGLASPIFLKERLNKQVWFGLALAMLGGAVVALHKSCGFGPAGFTCTGLNGIFEGKALLGNGLALFGAIMAAGYMMVGRSVRPVLGLISYSFLVYGFSAVFLFFALIFSGQPMGGYPVQIYFYIFLLALVPQILGHSSLNWALNVYPPRWYRFRC